MKFLSVCVNCSKPCALSDGREWCRECAGGPQPDPEKVDLAVERMQSYEEWKSQIQTDPTDPDDETQRRVNSNWGVDPVKVKEAIVRTNAKHIPSGPQLALDRAAEVDKEHTATQLALTREEPRGGPCDDLGCHLCFNPGTIDYSTLAPGRAVLAQDQHLPTATEIGFTNEGISRHTAAVQHALNLEMQKLLESPEMKEIVREIFLKYSKQNTYEIKEYKLGFNHCRNF